MGVLRFALAGFVAQVLVSAIGWMLIDDSPAGAWSNRDFGQWLSLDAMSAAGLTVIAGVSTRRWRRAGAVAGGCVLAVVLGCAAFIGYAVVNSA